MNGIEVTLEELDNIAGEFNNKFHTGEVSKFSVYISDEFSRYSDVIRSFFINKEKEIRNIYSAIRNKEFPFNKIKSADVNQARHIYREYFDGMNEYVFKMTDLKSTDQINTDVLKENLTKIAERDRIFIESLFGGDKNPVVEEDLNSAMKNIEVLIDINEDFNYFRSKINEIVNKYEAVEDNSIYANSIMAGICQYADSIRLYNHKCLEAILKCYTSIIESIQVRESVIPKPTIPEFQIF